MYHNERVVRRETGLDFDFEVEVFVSECFLFEKATQSLDK